MVSYLAFLMGLDVESIAWCDHQLCSYPQCNKYFEAVKKFTYVVFMNGHEMSFTVMDHVNSYTGIAYKTHTYVSNVDEDILQFFIRIVHWCSQFLLPLHWETNYFFSNKTLII
jgi:hypothetical protein